MKRAGDSVEFRSALRQELCVLDSMNEVKLQALVTKCGVTPVSDTSAHDYRGAIFGWLEVRRDSDEAAMKKMQATGGKGRPDVLGRDLRGLRMVQNKDLHHRNHLLNQKI